MAKLKKPPAKTNAERKDIYKSKKQIDKFTAMHSHIKKLRASNNALRVSEIVHDADVCGHLQIIARKEKVAANQMGQLVRQL